MLQNPWASCPADASHRFMAEQLVKSRGASRENRWGVFLETTVGAKLSVSLLDPRAGGALIPLDVGCLAIIFEKALSTPEETSFCQ